MPNNNGYSESILQSDNSCYLCGIGGELARHEPLDGIGRRSKSKALGLWVRLCPRCHYNSHQERVVQDKLRAACQRAAMAEYGWTKQDFINEFGRSYI